MSLIHTVILLTDKHEWALNRISLIFSIFSLNFINLLNFSLVVSVNIKSASSFSQRQTAEETHAKTTMVLWKRIVRYHRY